MPSFDIISKVDVQTLDNAINTAKRENLEKVFDFFNLVSRRTNVGPIPEPAQ